MIPLRALEPTTASVRADRRIRPHWWAQWDHRHQHRPRRNDDVDTVAGGYVNPPLPTTPPISTFPMRSMSHNADRRVSLQADRILPCRVTMISTISMWAWVGRIGVSARDAPQWKQRCQNVVSCGINAGGYVNPPLPPIPMIPTRTTRSTAINIDRWIAGAFRAGPMAPMLRRARRLCCV